MRRELNAHYTAELLKLYLIGLSEKFPMMPLNTILSNYLLMSDDGTEVTRLFQQGCDFYEAIKQIEEMPDTAASPKPQPFDPIKPKEIVKLTPNLLKSTTLRLEPIDPNANRLPPLPMVSLTKAVESASEG